MAEPAALDPQGTLVAVSIAILVLALAALGLRRFFGRSAPPTSRLPPPTAGAAPPLLLDPDRLRRTGTPEIVFAAGKTPDECVAAARGLVAAHGSALVTRACTEHLAALAAALPRGVAHPRSGCFQVGTCEPTLGPVAVVSAGTSDEPWAEEAALVLGHLGIRVVRIADVGVAGLHRLLARIDEIRACRAAIVAAGFEGALPSVVGGLVDCPVIGLPTPVGYGMAAGGETALRAMLASCAPGVTVVNIGNGVGAACAAAAICRSASR